VSDARLLECSLTSDRFCAGEGEAEVVCCVTKKISNEK
jgi:hypothetical protein